MGWKKCLYSLLAAVQNAWDGDLKSHIDFEGWQFISRNRMNFDEIDKSKPYVCFGSFQDYLGKNTSTGGIKTKMSGCMQQIGIVWFLMNIIMVHGEKTQKNF